MKRVLISAALVLMAIAAGAQTQPWSLEQCMDYAIEHNISVKQREIAAASAEITLNTDKNSRLPYVQGSISQDFSFGRGLGETNTYVNSSTSSTSGRVGAGLQLFEGFRVKNTIEADKLGLSAAVADLDKAKNDIRISVARAYIQILYDYEISDIACRQVVSDSIQTARLEGLYKNGKTDKASLARQESSLQQSRYTLAQSQSSLMLDLLNLAQLLELPSPENFTVERVAPKHFAICANPDEILASAMAVMPEIEAERIRLDQSGFKEKIARSQLYPSLSLSGGVGSNYYKSKGYNSSSFGDQIKNNFSQSVGITLSVPIFNRFATRNAIRSAELATQSQSLQLDNATKALYKEIQQAYYNALTSETKCESSAKSVESAQESFRLMEAKYENGKANFAEYNDSRTALSRAEGEYAQARYENMFNQALLDFYAGKPLVF